MNIYLLVGLISAILIIVYLVIKLYHINEQISFIRDVLEDIKTGKLDKLPSKAKGDQLTCIDKARMLYKIGSVTDDFMQRLEKKNNEKFRY